MRIGQLADGLGITPATIRYYERIGLLPEPERSPSGYREYPGEIVGRVRFIRTAQTVGFQLDEIGEILDLRDQGQTPCAHVRQLISKHARELEERIDDLQRMRSDLQLLANVDTDGTEQGGAVHCQILEHAEASVVGH
jgi:MerR family transcriptional regulator, copper efflux regulator